MTKARIWREAPGHWRCRVPGSEWVGFAPTWGSAMRLGRSLTELATASPTAAVSATGHTTPTDDEMLSGDEFIERWYTPELSGPAA